MNKKQILYTIGGGIIIIGLIFPLFTSTRTWDLSKIVVLIGFIILISSIFVKGPLLFDKKETAKPKK